MATKRKRYASQDSDRRTTIYLTPQQKDKIRKNSADMGFGGNVSAYLRAVGLNPNLKPNDPRPGAAVRLPLKRKACFER